VDIPEEALARDKPTGSMVACGLMPELPVETTQFSEKEQAKVILNKWAETGELYSECAKRHSGLVQWIEVD